MITLKNVTLRRGAKVLLDNASVTLNPGEKVGLVGRNGAGKSSMFALLDGSLHEDAGDYSMPAQWRMGQVSQDMPETAQGATDFVIDGDTRLLAAQAEVLAAEVGNDGDRMAQSTLAGLMGRMAGYTGQEVTITWSGLNYHLQSVHNFGDAWEDVPGASSPYVRATDGDHRFYRLICR